MPAGGGIEGGDAHQAVHADLRQQQPHGVLALDLEGDRLEARLVPRLDVRDGGPEAFALRPAEVHAQEHLRPVLRLRAAGAGVDGDQGVAVVLRPAEEGFGLQVFDVVAKLLELRRQFRDHRLAFVAEFEEGSNVAELPGQGLLGFDHPLQVLALLQELLGGLRLAPEVGFVQLLVQVREPGPKGRGVKGSSAARRRGHGAAQTVVPVPRSSPLPVTSVASIQNLRASAAKPSRAQSAANQSPWRA